MAKQEIINEGAFDQEIRTQINENFTELYGTKGTVTLNGATGVTVSAPAVTADSIIVFTLKTVGGTVSPNAPNVKTITPGTGFTVAGTASDTSVYNYLILG